MFDRSHWPWTEVFGLGQNDLGQNLGKKSSTKEVPGLTPSLPHAEPRPTLPRTWCNTHPYTVGHQGGLGQKYWWVIFWSIWPLQYLIQMVLTYFALRSRITAIFITLNFRNFVKMAKIAFFGIFTVNFMYLNLIRLSLPVYMFSEMSYILGFYQFWDHKWTPLLPVWNRRHFLATKMIIFMFFLL